MFYNNNLLSTATSALNRSSLSVGPSAAVLTHTRTLQLQPLLAADDLWGALEIQASTAQEQLGLQQSQLEATGCLRQLLAGAAGTERPVLSEAAQAFLGEWE